MRWFTRAAVAVVCTALLGGVVTPAWAGEPPPAGPGDLELGGFALGDRLEAALDERDGSVRFAMPVGPVSLSWDSRMAAVDRDGFGQGWGINLTFVQTLGGVRVVSPSGAVHQADATTDSGLVDAPTGDVRFVQESTVLPARDDGVVGEQPVAFRLHELGGRTTWYAASGAPVATTDAHGNRLDWRWASGEQHRLIGTVDADGVETVLDWSDPGAVLVREGVNVGAGVEFDDRQSPRAPEVVWRIGLDAGRVSAIEDPVGSRTVFRYEPGGLISRVAAPSGLTTEVSWQVFDDGVRRAERVRGTDATGRELSVRDWDPVGTMTASGWPVRSDAAATADGKAGESYSTVVSDGVSRVESEYDPRHLLVRRSAATTTSGGELLLQERSFTYPGADEGSLPAQLPANWSKPATSTLTVHDASGATRSMSESFVFDPLGRVIEQRSADGTVMTRAYAPDAADPDLPPLGLPVLERTVAPDGLSAEIRYGLNEAGTAVVRAEEWRQAAAGGPLTRAALTEYDVADDGRVTEQRVHPNGDAGGTPQVTRTEHRVDLAAGTVTESQTVGVGTDAARTVTAVASLRAGGASRSTDATGTTSFVATDAAGRVVETVDPAGRRTTTAYSTAAADGRNATVSTAPNGVVVTEVRDALSRVVELIDNVDHGRPVPGFTRTAERRHYPSPGVTEVTDAWGATTRTVTDLHGRVLETRDPAGVLQRATYDDIARTVTTEVASVEAPGEVLVSSVRQLDDRGALIEQHGERADGAPVPRVSAVYDGFGRQTEGSDGTRTTRTTFDVHGNPVGTTIEPADVSGGDRGGDGDPAGGDTSGLAKTDDGMQAERRFDGFGRPVQKTLSDETGSRSGGSRAFDVLGRVIAETDQRDRTTRFEFTPDDLVSRSETEDGRVTETDYDPRTRQPVETRVSSPVGAPVRTGFEYDAVTDALIAVFDPADPDGSKITYRHDAHGNLLETRYPDGKTIEHTYDEHGRREIALDGATSAYDAANRLVRQSTTNGAELLTSYWADGTRRQLTATASDGSRRVSEFRWDGATLLNDAHLVDGEPHGTASYLFAGDRVARSVSDGAAGSGVRDTAYSVTDRHGNVTELTGPDGAVLQRAAYADYGSVVDLATREPIAATAPADAVGDPARHPFGYAGEYTDVTGDQLLGVRSYRPSLMHFTTRDTAPQLNAYAYGNLNPIMKIDPTGRTASDDLAVGVLGLVLGIGGFIASVLSGGAAAIVFSSIATGIDVSLFAVQQLPAEQFGKQTPTAYGSVDSVLGGLAVMMGLVSLFVGGHANGVRALKALGESEEATSLAAVPARQWSVPSELPVFREKRLELLINTRFTKYTTPVAGLDTFPDLPPIVVTNMLPGGVREGTLWNHLASNVQVTTPNGALTSRALTADAVSRIQYYVDDANALWFEKHGLRTSKAQLTELVDGWRAGADMSHVQLAMHKNGDVRRILEGYDVADIERTQKAALDGLGADAWFYLRYSAAETADAFPAEYEGLESVVNRIITGTWN